MRYSWSGSFPLFAVGLAWLMAPATILFAQPVTSRWEESPSLVESGSHGFDLASRPSATYRPLSSQVLLRSTSDQAAGLAFVGSRLGGAIGAVTYEAKGGGELESLIDAAVIGSSIGIPLGVWFADAGQSELSAPLIASISVGAVGLILRPPPALIVAIPLSQVAAAVAFRSVKD